VAAADRRQHVLKLNVGCGLDAVPGWENLDNSWSLVVSSHGLLRVGFDILERVTRRRLYTPYPSESVAVIYSSHMLEHLPRRDVERFLREAYRVLVPGGVLRLALPDLERKARAYVAFVEQVRQGCDTACVPADEFVRSTLLGLEEGWSLRNLVGLVRFLLARERHCWMWDAPSLMILLRQIGFSEVRETGFRESWIGEVHLLDLESRRDESFYIEARK
jgi:predicted SAM-dependent methyltransferase